MGSAVGAVASVVGAGASLLGSKKSSDAQKKAAKSAAQVQWNMYEQTREDMEPWREAGEWALEELRGMVGAGPGEFEESPGYQFRLAEGEKGINRAMAARGRWDSGAALKALTRFNQDYASNEYDKFLARYYQSLGPFQSLAGVGQTATTYLGGIGQQTAGNVAQAYNAAGAAQAAGYQNMAGAVNQGVGNLYNLYMLNKWGLMNPVQEAQGG